VNSIAYIFYFVWSQFSRSKTAPKRPVILHLYHFIEQNTNKNQGNLLGIQTFLTTDDYSTEYQFYSKIDGYLFEAKKRVG